MSLTTLMSLITFMSLIILIETGWLFLETSYERLGLLLLGSSPGGANSNFWVSTQSVTNSKNNANSCERDVGPSSDTLFFLVV